MSCKKFLLFILLLLSNYYVFAQCAMCKAVVEKNLESGGTKGAGLNDGILYLMAVPYFLMLVFAILFYLQNRQKQSA